LRASRLIIIILVLIQITSGNAFSQTQVAVIDATIGRNVPHNAGSVVANEINEIFVKSEKYTAVDRTYVSTVILEQHMQLSGIVRESDAAKMGTMLGVQYICAPHITVLDGIYSISARMIDVESTKVVAQESYRLPGGTSVLFQIAEIVGAKLIGEEWALALEDGKQKEFTDSSGRNPSETNESFSELQLRFSFSGGVPVIGNIEKWYIGAGFGIGSNIIPAVDIGIYTRWSYNHNYGGPSDYHPLNFVSGSFGAQITFNFRPFSLYLGGGIYSSYGGKYGPNLDIDADVGILIPAKSALRTMVGFSLFHGIIIGVEWVK